MMPRPCHGHLPSVSAYGTYGHEWCKTPMPNHTHALQCFVGRFLAHLRPSFEFEKVRSQKNCMSDESETSHWCKLRCEPSAGENTIRMHTYRTEANKRNCRRDMVSMRYGLHETCMWCYRLSPTRRNQQAEEWYQVSESLDACCWNPLRRCSDKTRRKWSSTRIAMDDGVHVDWEWFNS